MLPFPFLIMAFIMLVFVYISYFKDKKTYILTNIIAFWGPIEFASYITQTVFCIMFATYKYAAMSAIAAISYFILNIAFAS